MSDRWVPRRDSPWSSERERASRLRKDRESPEQPTTPADESASSTPLRRTSRTSDQGRVGSRRERQPAQSTSAGPEETEPGTSSARSSRTSRFRPHRTDTTPAESGNQGGGSPPSGGLPDLPGSSNSGGSGSNRIIILGALLFLAMAAIALLPQLLGDDDGDDGPTPTPELIQTPTPAAQQADVEEAPPAQSLADAEYVACIDAGHGGWDAGRVREANSRAPAILEKEINLGMAWMLKERLESEGIGVVMTRPSGLAVNTFNEDVNGDGETLQDSEQAGDRDELQARINVCNDAEADVLISLHLNGFDDSSARGYEVLYTPAPFREFGDRNADLATFVYREIGSAYNEAGFDTTPRGTIQDVDLDAEMHSYGAERHLFMTGPAIENADFTLVPSAMPGIVIEPVFITNDDDAAFIAVLQNQQLLVNAYADGILTYFEQHPEAP